MSHVGTSSERLRLYERLGRAYELAREWERAREAHERRLEEARGAGDRLGQWNALQHLAVLGTDYSLRPEEDDELFRGTRRAAEESGEAPSSKDGTGAADGFVWSSSAARGHAAEALHLARELRREDLIAHSVSSIAALDCYAGRWEGAVSGAAEARSLYAALGDRVMEAEFTNLAAVGAAMTGFPEEGVRLGRERLAAAEELGGRDIHVADCHGVVFGLLELGEYGEALRLSRRVVEAGRSLGSTERSVPGLMVLGDANLALFRLGDAEGAYREMAGLLVPGLLPGLAESKLCAVAALAGEWGEAHRQALGSVRARGGEIPPLTAALHLHHEIEALLRGGEEELAREDARRLGEQVGENRRFRLVHLRMLAAIARWDGEAGEALSRLREAEALAEGMGLPGELWQVRAEIGELHEERDEGGEAREAFSLAAGVVRTLVARISDEALQTAFLSSARVRRVLERGAKSGAEEAS